MPPQLAQRRAPRLAWGLGGCVVILQICYPLILGHQRGTLTVLTVSCFAAASLLHVGREHGPRAAAILLVIAGGAGLTVEIIGVHTGFPFGAYSYTGRLGPQLASVPLIIPLAWTMMSWPALVATRHLVTSPVGTAAVGGVALASWDLFLDPQMVAAGNWVWHTTGPAPQGIPLTNDLGWLATAVLVMAVLDRAIPRQDSPRDGLPVALYLWTWGGSVIGNVFFFGRPLVAVIGGVAMGLIVLPLARTLGSPPPSPRPAAIITG